MVHVKGSISAHSQKKHGFHTTGSHYFTLRRTVKRIPFFLTNLTIFLFDLSHKISPCVQSLEATFQYQWCDQWCEAHFTLWASRVASKFKSSDATRCEKCIQIGSTGNKAVFTETAIPGNNREKLESFL